MSRENPQQEVAEPELRDASPRVLSRGMHDAERYAGHTEAKHARRSASTASDSTIAFKFGGSSLLGAERMRRSEEHTSELQSPCNLVCRLLLEKKKKFRRMILMLTSSIWPT